MDNNPYVQDLTYVAILKDYGTEMAPLVERPESYNPAEFDCMCLELCSDSTQNPVSCDKMLDYGRLPNDKFMINWPNFGNDHYADLLEKSQSERSALLQDAKNTTLSWIYHLQTEGNYTHIGLAADEFPTEDRLALIPYIRESRRVEGIDRLYEYDLANPYALEERPLYQSAIAVGDYPLDHHRKKNPVPKQIDFTSIPSYSVPYGVLIPKSVNGLIVAEKSISISNVANGTTRLQPVVLQLGQVAGLAAVMSADIGVAPALLDVRSGDSMAPFAEIEGWMHYGQKQEVACRSDQRMARPKLRSISTGQVEDFRCEAFSLCVGPEVWLVGGIDSFSVLPQPSCIANADSERRT